MTAFPKSKMTILTLTTLTTLFDHFLFVLPKILCILNAVLHKKEHILCNTLAE